MVRKGSVKASVIMEHSFIVVAIWVALFSKDVGVLKFKLLLLESVSAISEFDHSALKMAKKEGFETTRLW